MTTFVRWLAVLSSVIPSVAYGAGFAYNDTFLVYTPAEPTQEAGQELAERILARATEFRASVAREWLGDELAATAGRTIIDVTLSDDSDRGLTWAKDHPSRKFHNIFLATTANRASSSTLHHEIVHTVLATRFPYPYRLPSWVEEGIACRYDHKASQAQRREIVRTWIEERRAPRLVHLLETADIKSFDDDSYAAGASLVTFLLTRGDRATLLQFAEAGTQLGWDRALKSHYGMDDIGRLQQEWEAWLTTTVAPDDTQRTAYIPSDRGFSARK